MLRLNCTGYFWTATKLQDQIDNLSSPKYVLGGDGPNGGIVYYVDGSGEHGLEAQAADESTTLSWFPARAAASAYGSGWHLPTKTELDLLYKQKNVVGGFVDEGYWSSTTDDGYGSGAWWQSFYDGRQGSDDTVDPFRVRAVRAF